jgi:ketosteroid isomerase-like protein
MSQKNVEVVRAAWRAYRDRGIGAALEYFSEDCLCEDFPELPDRATYHGRDGWRQRDRQFRRPWADIVFEPREFMDTGGDEVVVVAAMHGHGQGSEVPMRLTFAFVYELRDGSIVRDRAFTSKDQALEAAGLRE